MKYVNIFRHICHYFYEIQIRTICTYLSIHYLSHFLIKLKNNIVIKLVLFCETFIWNIYIFFKIYSYRWNGPYGWSSVVCEIVWNHTHGESRTIMIRLQKKNFAQMKYTLVKSPWSAAAPRRCCVVFFNWFPKSIYAKRNIK